MAKKSDLSRAFSEDGTLKTHIGGQALIEGVMMRGKYNWAVGVREPDGSIYEEQHDLSSGKQKNSWMYWPLVRGCRAMVESLVLGYKALEIAAMHAYVDEEEGQNDTSVNLDTSAAVSLEDSLDGLNARGSFAHGPRDEFDFVNNCTKSNSAAEFAQTPVASGLQKGSSSCPSDSVGSTRFVGVSDAYLQSTQDEAPIAVASGLQKDSDSACGARSAMSSGADAQHKFSWKDDFGRPDTMIDALCAQASLEVVEGEGGEPQVRADSAPKEDKNDESAEEEPFFGKKEMALSMVLGLVLGIVLFIVAPAFLTNLIVGEYDSNTLLWNIVDGILRVAVFVFYIWLIGRMEDIKRMFGYHGAEHKTIHCYEHGLELTPENARQFPRLHVRCGTAFLIMVMIIAILVYTITPLNALIAAWGVPDGAPKLLLVILVRILLMPVIAGISYEITVKWAGSNPDNPLVKVVLWPGMQMQYLTTNEPDDSMLECAISAMKQVIEREEAEKSAS